VPGGGIVIGEVTPQLSDRRQFFFGWRLLAFGRIEESDYCESGQSNEHGQFSRIE
jgi:hypothetical protein